MTSHCPSITRPVLPQTVHHTSIKPPSRPELRTAHDGLLDTLAALCSPPLLAATQLAAQIHEKLYSVYELNCCFNGLGNKRELHARSPIQAIKSKGLVKPVQVVLR